MFKHVCLAKVFSLSVFSCRCCSFEGRAARSSAKSRSSNWKKRVHWMPVGLSAFALRKTQSMAIRKRMGERIQPCRKPGNHGEPFCQVPVHYNAVLELLVEHPHKYDHLWKKFL